MPRKIRARKLIVGIDPGLNCGLAVLTFSGEPILIESQRGLSLTKLIEKITSLGEPTIISSDVSPAPSSLEKISKKLNAVLFEPAISMSTEEKSQLAKAYMERYNIKLRNMHEVDALAAAIKAYQHYKNKFEQIDAKLKSIKSDFSPDAVKELVVRGYSIARAIKILQGSKAPPIPPIIRGYVSQEERLKMLVKELRERLRFEKEKIKILREINNELRLKIKALSMEIEKLKEALEKSRSKQELQIRREREYQRLIDEISFLKNKISAQEAQIREYKRMLAHYQRLSELESKKNLILLKPIEFFTKEGLEKSFRLYDVKVGDSVFILDPSGGGPTTAETLSKRGVKVIVARGMMSHQALEVFEKYHVPVIPADKININWVDGLPYADPEEIKRAIKEGKIMKTTEKLEVLKSILDDIIKEAMEEESK